jgi:hypothetical protein
MKEEKVKIEFQFPASLDPTRDKYDPEFDKLKTAKGGRFKELELANKILEQTPIPQWILDL